ncbi:MAG: dihydropteroate synthase [Gammaproteobacteria bacterium]|nr:MAG: dihydropteroate synthase [Gammaproteobacteria bacterium]
MQKEKEKIKIMGILNITTDSFSDGGLYFKKSDAIERAMIMIDEGANIIDIGGESSRPTAKSITIEDEIKAVIPVIEAIRSKTNVTISIDTCKPAVMRLALDAGANIINDITALNCDESVDIVVKYNCPVCLMHMQGMPQNMQNNPTYKNVVTEIYKFFKDKIKYLVSCGMDEKNIIIDPGFGFGKTLQHNIDLLQNLAYFKNLKKPILVGLSYKSMITMITNDFKTKNRLGGSIALSILAVKNGANIVRTHDITETKQAIEVFNQAF